MDCSSQLVSIKAENRPTISSFFQRNEMSGEVTEEEEEKTILTLKRSGDKPLSYRVFKVFLTLASVGVLSYHLYTLVDRYQKEPVNIQTSTGQFRFPDIHVCPRVPFSDSIIRVLRQHNNQSEWKMIQKTLRRMEATIETFPDSDDLNRWSVVTRAFWDTLEPSMLFEVLSLPLYEAIIRLKVNDIGEI